MSTFKTSLFDFAEESAATYSIPQIKLSYVSSPAIRASKAARDSESLSRAFRASYEAGEIEYHEVMKVAYLNHQLKVIGIQTVGVGNATATISDNKAIFAGALLCRASAIALCHNHPSGALNPSTVDDNLTRKINEGCKILDLDFIDHIILTDESFYSYRDNGKI